MESGSETPYLSIVLTGRNDGFGGDFNERLFRTLEFNHAQLSARGIPHEFVFVEWRPVSGVPWLAEVLGDRYRALVPETLRSFVVDSAYHDALSLNPRLQFQEFVAKNVGIRRSRGAFVLTTNTDIMLSRGVLDALEQRTLQPRVLYRAERVDLRKDLDSHRSDWSLLEDERNHEHVNRIKPPIYSNAAGDFLLLDRDSYLELRGFNEVYRVAKIHIDRNFCLKALSSGLRLLRLMRLCITSGMARSTTRPRAMSIDPPRPHGAIGDGVVRSCTTTSRTGACGARRRGTCATGLDCLEFTWAAVPPAVSLRRVVLPVARQRAAESPGVEWRPEMDRSPYPVTVTHRDATSSGASDRTDQHVSHQDPAGAINRARLEFLATLDLPLQGKRVLDAGCGVGHHAPFYTSRGCRVVGIDGRPENIEEMRQRYPQVEGIVGDFQTLDLEALGSFDVVHCLGLLDQLDSPVEALRRLARVCCGQLLLETIVCDADRAVMLLADEVGSANQALAGLGCRPSPSFVAMALDRLGFPYVYGTTMPPQHPDFQFEWRNNFEARRDGANLRCIFVASRTPLACDHLTLLLPAAGSMR